MRVLVYGAGAIGSFVGGLLCRASHDVTLLCRPDHAKAVNSRGLEVEGLSSIRCQPRAILSLAKAPEIDLVILTTKAYDTEAAAREIARLPPIPILSLQNGLDNHILMARNLGMDRVYLGTTSIGVTFLGPGRVRHAGNGPTRIGEPTRQADASTAKMIARLLTEAGLPAEYSADILTELWKKGVVNNAINPLTAIHRVKNGSIVDSRELRLQAESLAREAGAVAKALGFEVGDGVALAMQVADLTRENRSSMLQDIEKGRRTEIEHITGVVVSEADSCGIPTPASAKVLEAVRALESASPASTSSPRKRPSEPLRSPTRNRKPARSASAPPKRGGRRKASTKRRSRS